MVSSGRRGGGAVRALERLRHGVMACAGGSIDALFGLFAAPAGCRPPSTSRPREKRQPAVAGRLGVALHVALLVPSLASSLFCSNAPPPSESPLAKPLADRRLMDASARLRTLAPAPSKGVLAARPPTMARRAPASSGSDVPRLSMTRNACLPCRRRKAKARHPIPFVPSPRTRIHG